MGNPATDEALGLLELLDASVHARRGRSDRLSGSIGIGVWSPRGARWWCASFGPKVETGFVDRTPKADALVLMTSGEAEALVSGKRQRGPLRMKVAGKRPLLDAFFEEYLTARDMLSFRSSEGC